MTEKTKRAALITAGILLCAALAMGIVSRLAATPMPVDPAIADEAQETKEPVVSVDAPEADMPEVKVEIQTDAADDPQDPGEGADSSGTEQTIQATPTKPDTQILPYDPNEVKTTDRASETGQSTEPPTAYEPEQAEVKAQPEEPAGGSTNSTGQIYVPGFGYVTPSGPNTVIEANDMYENGNKIGIMGG